MSDRGPKRGRGVTLDEPAKPYSVVVTQRHGRGAPGPSCSSWCSHRARPPSGAGYPSSWGANHIIGEGICAWSGAQTNYEI
eukprot:1621333-Pyramimonas_sp.AAC.1